MMLISAVLDVLFNVFSFCLNLIPVTIPSLPQQILDLWDTFLEMISAGMGLLGNWFDTGFIVICLTVSFALFTFEHSWEFIRWLLRFLRVIP